MKFKVVMVLVLLCMFGVMPVANAYAGSIEVPFQDKDTVVDILRTQVDKIVEVQLKSGQTIKGRLATVKEKTVRVKELDRRSYFDAFIQIDAIAAVIIRTQK